MRLSCVPAPSVISVVARFDGQSIYRWIAWRKLHKICGNGPFPLRSFCTTCTISKPKSIVLCLAVKPRGRARSISSAFARHVIYVLERNTKMKIKGILPIDYWWWFQDGKSKKVKRQSVVYHSAMQRHGSLVMHTPLNTGCWWRMFPLLSHRSYMTFDVPFLGWRDKYMRSVTDKEEVKNHH